MELRTKLLRPVDNAPLVVFRIFLGFLLFAETLGSIFTGWVRKVLVEPEFTFSHIGLDWLQPLPGYGMYFYFLTMSLLGILVMIGYKYRYSLGAFTLLWAGFYFMEKESYNNHYYLLLLICIIMLFLPANGYASLDAKLSPEKRRLSMPQWCSWVLILQVAIVYFYATVSKFYPDWMNGNFIRLLLEGKHHQGWIGSLFSQYWFQLFIAWTGMFFDMLIIPLLLWKQTRTWAFLAALIFHLFNAAVLQIGIFPFFALSFTVFFYPPDKIRKLFLRKKPELEVSRESAFTKTAMLWYFFLPYFILQLALPLRHHFIQGDVFWTEEGHRLSWRMMLRQKSGTITFRVIDKKTQQQYIYPLTNLSAKQHGFVSTKPDGIWQMAQRIHREYAQKGQDVQVFADCHVSLNGSAYRQFIDPETDLAKAPWNYFGHSSWIRLYEDNLPSNRPESPQTLH